LEKLFGKIALPIALCMDERERESEREMREGRRAKISYTFSSFI